MKTKVVVNHCYGGFALSTLAISVLGGRSVAHHLERHDKRLVEIVEKMGPLASSTCSKLEVVEIEGTLYRIDDYDGFESVEVPNDICWVDASKE